MIEVIALRDEDRDMYDATLSRLREQSRTPENVTFMHTWEWGEVLFKTSAQFERILIVKDDVPIGVGQLALRVDHRIKYWYAPRGIAMDYTDIETTGLVYRAVRSHCRKLRSRVAFLRVDPNIPVGSPIEAALDAEGARKAAIFHQAERCWITEIRHREDEQFEYMVANGMRRDVMRRVKRSRNKGLTVRASNDPADLEQLVNLLHGLDDKKGGIGMHPDEHYRMQFSRLAPAGHQMVFVAEQDGQVCAANLIAIYGEEASWLHGATTTDHELRKLSPAYQLHIDTMRWLAANRPEVKRYNWWGIVGDENYHEGHPRYGYSHFKRGFGGYKIEYLRAREFVFRPIEWSLLYLADVYRTRKYGND